MWLKSTFDVSPSATDHAAELRPEWGNRRVAALTNIALAVLFFRYSLAQRISNFFSEGRMQWMAWCLLVITGLMLYFPTIFIRKMNKMLHLLERIEANSRTGNGAAAGR